MRRRSTNYIDLPSEKVKEIAGVKGVSERTVYSALNYTTKSSLAMLIRAWALNNGGKNKQVTVL